jgi:hypothetical protein
MKCEPPPDDDMTKPITRLEAGVKLADILGSVVQTLAVIVGGAWILFRYLNIEHATEAQRLEQLRLSNQQAALTLQTQKASEQLRVDELRLANETARFTLSQQQEQRLLRQKELEISVALHQLEARKVRHEVGYTEQRKFAYRFLIDAHRDQGASQYVVNHGFELVNTSQRELEVSVLAIDYFIGTARDGDTALVTPIGSPQNRWNADSEQGGHVSWKKIGCVASITPAADQQIGKKVRTRLSDCQVVTGGGGTGYLRPSERLEYTDTYHVVAAPDAYVLFVTSYCLDRCKKQEDMQYATKWVSLRDGATDRTFAQVATKDDK